MSTQTSEKVFKTVNGKTFNTEGDTSISFIRPKELAAAGTVGVIAQGVYEGTLPNQFDESKPDYKVRGEDGSLIVLNSAGSLKSQMSKISEGSYIRVSYLGMQPMTSGKMAGKASHRFVVEVAE